MRHERHRADGHRELSTQAPGMDRATASRLSALTGAFYEQVSESFSATRQNAWTGWQSVVDACGLHGLDAPRVLDVACGNLRFERFLAEAGIAARVRAYDACDALSKGVDINTVSISYSRLDVVSALERNGELVGVLGKAGADLAVCFGFMHHLPLREQRALLVEALAASVAPGGHIAISFWQLSRSERLLAKAQATTARAVAELGLRGFGPGDYLLGWQGRADVLRFCHDFSEEEIDELALASTAREVARFSADGATNDLNRYLILQA